MPIGEVLFSQIVDRVESGKGIKSEPFSIPKRARPRFHPSPLMSPRSGPTFLQGIVTFGGRKAGRYSEFLWLLR